MRLGPQTLDLMPNNKPVNDTGKPVIVDALRHIQDNFSAKNQRDTRNNIINQLLRDGYNVYWNGSETASARTFGTKQFIQAKENIEQKLKPLDFTLHGTQATKDDEKLATAAFTTILKKGDYAATFRDKNGMASNLVCYGDSFRLISPRTQDGFPVQFTMIDNSAAYVDSLATSMRGGTRPARKFALVYQSTWDQFVKMFPDGKDKATIGRIPRPTGEGKDTTQAWVQKVSQNQQLIEWCYYFDLEHQTYCLFAGPTCAILDLQEGKDYPYILKRGKKYEEAYIPVSHYHGLDSKEGFYNYGVLDYCADLAIAYRKIYNMLYQSVEDNVYPLELVNLPEDEAELFFGKVQTAMHERSLGRRAFIPIKQNGISNQSVSMQPFYTSALVGEAEAIFNRIDLDYRRLGIYLDEIEEKERTATEILKNIEKSNSFVREIMSKNTSAVEFELDVAMDMTTEFIPNSDKTPLNLTTMIDGPDGEPVRADNLTLGIAAKEFKARNWFFVVNSKSGVVPSNTMAQAQANQVLGVAAPGSALQKAAVKTLVELNDFDYLEDPATPMNAPTPEGGATPATEVPAAEAARDEVRFKELSAV